MECDGSSYGPLSYVNSFKLSVNIQMTIDKKQNVRAETSRDSTMLKLTYYINSACPSSIDILQDECKIY